MGMRGRRCSGWRASPTRSWRARISASGCDAWRASRSRWRPTSRCGGSTAPTRRSTTSSRPRRCSIRGIRSRTCGAPIWPGMRSICAGCARSCPRSTWRSRSSWSVRRSWEPGCCAGWTARAGGSRSCSAWRACPRSWRPRSRRWWRRRSARFVAPTARCPCDGPRPARSSGCCAARPAVASVSRSSTSTGSRAR